MKGFTSGGQWEYVVLDIDAQRGQSSRWSQGGEERWPPSLLRFSNDEPLRIGVGVSLATSIEARRGSDDTFVTLRKKL